MPQPFGFDMRDKVKTKTIRERKIEEMIAEKKLLGKGCEESSFEIGQITQLKRSIKNLI